MSRWVERLLRGFLWFVAAPYVVLLVIAFAYDRISADPMVDVEQARAAVPTELPSGRAGAVREGIASSGGHPPSTGERRAGRSSTIAERAIQFMTRRGGRWRVSREEEWFRELAILAEDATYGSDMSPELLLAVTFRESSWTPSVVGDAGEIGLTQLHYLRSPGILRGFSAATVKRSPSLQLWLGVRRYEEALAVCDAERSWPLNRLDDRDLEALLNYASGKCSGPTDPAKRAHAMYSARRVIGWAATLQTSWSQP